MPIPSWKTELKEVAPNVFAYIQGGGPGIEKKPPPYSRSQGRGAGPAATLKEYMEIFKLR
jgi:hypothetical protein